MIAALKRILADPLTRGLDQDDPETTRRRRTIVRTKHFLRLVYQDWYERICHHLPSGDGAVLELGSGPGFLREYIPSLISSELLACPGVDLICNGQELPFAPHSLRCIVLIDVLHHMPAPRDFLIEACRCLRAGGKILMIEPWVTPWSTFVYQNLHHEPFLPDAPEWAAPRGGPLSGANGALPWILLQRDRSRFDAEMPALHVQRIEPFMPFRYLVSGGVSLRTLVPAATFGLWTRLENGMAPWMDWWAMFAFVAISKR